MLCVCTAADRCECHCCSISLPQGAKGREQRGFRLSPRALQVREEAFPRSVCSPCESQLWWGAGHLPSFQERNSRKCCSLTPGPSDTGTKFTAVSGYKSVLPADAKHFSELAGCLQRAGRRQLASCSPQGPGSHPGSCCRVLLCWEPSTRPRSWLHPGKSRVKRGSAWSPLGQQDGAKNPHERK